MASDSASFFANLFLYYYESRRIKDLQKKDLTRVRKLFNVFCFTDGLNTINDDGIFESNFTNVYPEELELHRENGNIIDAIFLDLDIKIKNNQFEIGHVDKETVFLSASL